MNTDNMSVLGITFDYGPYAFLDRLSTPTSSATTAITRRYAFDRQPAVGLWNLARFAEALLTLVLFEEANAALNRYPSRFEAVFGEAIRGKLGLVTVREDDAELVGEMLALMAANRVDYTRWFRTLATVERSSGAAPEPLRAMVHDLERLDGWVTRYVARLAAETVVDQSARPGG